MRNKFLSIIIITLLMLNKKYVFAENFGYGIDFGIGVSGASI